MQDSTRFLGCIVAGFTESTPWCGLPGRLTINHNWQHSRRFQPAPTSYGLAGALSVVCWLFPSSERLFVATIGQLPEFRMSSVRRHSWHQHYAQSVGLTLRRIHGVCLPPDKPMRLRAVRGAVPVATHHPGFPSRVSPLYLHTVRVAGSLSSVGVRSVRRQRQFAAQGHARAGV